MTTPQHAMCMFTTVLVFMWWGGSGRTHPFVGSASLLPHTTPSALRHSRKHHHAKVRLLCSTQQHSTLQSKAEADPNSCHFAY